MLLTTHFMDEAGVLGDRVAIMRAGARMAALWVSYGFNQVKHPSGLLWASGSFEDSRCFLLRDPCRTQKTQTGNFLYLEGFGWWGAEASKSRG